jgi:hypothetical protein
LLASLVGSPPVVLGDAQWCSRKFRHPRGVGSWSCFGFARRRSCPGDCTPSHPFVNTAPLRKAAGPPSRRRPRTEAFFATILRDPARFNHGYVCRTASSESSATPKLGEAGRDRDGRGPARVARRTRTPPENPGPDHGRLSACELAVRDAPRDLHAAASRSPASPPHTGRCLRRRRRARPTAGNRGKLVAHGRSARFPAVPHAPAAASQGHARHAPAVGSQGHARPTAWAMTALDTGGAWGAAHFRLYRAIADRASAWITRWI